MVGERNNETLTLVQVGIDRDIADGIFDGQRGEPKPSCGSGSSR